MLPKTVSRLWVWRKSYHYWVAQHWTPKFRKINSYDQLEQCIYLALLPSVVEFWTCCHVPPPHISLQPLTSTHSDSLSNTPELTTNMNNTSAWTVCSFPSATARCNAVDARSIHSLYKTDMEWWPECFSPVRPSLSCKFTTAGHNSYTNNNLHSFKVKKDVDTWTKTKVCNIFPYMPYNG